MLKQLFMGLAMAALIPAAPAFAAGSHVFSVNKTGKFEDVRDDLVIAIEGRGIKINHTNHIAEMLARTGADLGASKQVYLQGEQVEFCKSNLSRAQMEADPSNMVFCPYIISVYTTPDKPEQVTVAFRRPTAVKADKATTKALKAVEDLLVSIVREATQ